MSDVPQVPIGLAIPQPQPLHLSPESLLPEERIDLSHLPWTLPAVFPYGLLALWLLFPLHAPITLLVLDAPFGRFARTPTNWARWLNIGGRKAWVVMELVAPLTFMVNLPAGDVTTPARTLAALYLMHYFHRAIMSPIMLAPNRAPIHIIVVLAAVIFNYLNATLIAYALVMFPPRGGWTFYVGIAIWALGFMGNVYHDEILHDLRRKKGHTLVSTPSPAPEDVHSNGRYRIPRGGMFELVSFPNYLCEWIEWTGFAIAAAPSLTIPVPPGTVFSVMGYTLDPAALGAVAPTALLAPAWAFVLCEVTSMLPRAIRGHKWYKDQFKTYPKNRKAVIPGLV